MRRIAATLRWEATLQSRHQFYAVTAVVALVWVVLFRLLPAAVRDQAALLVPLFVLVNLQITAFYFAAALVLLERGQGVPAALLTSPLEAGEYLWVKAVALTALGVAENATVVLLVFGPGQAWTWLVLGTTLLAALYVFLGLALVATHHALNTFLIPSVGWITLFSLPLLGYFSIVPRWLFFWHPMTPSLALLEASGRDISTAGVVFGLLGSVGWCTAAFLWARDRMVHLIAPASA